MLGLLWKILRSSKKLHTLFLSWIACLDFFNKLQFVPDLISQYICASVFHTKFVFKPFFLCVYVCVFVRQVGFGSLLSANAVCATTTPRSPMQLMRPTSLQSLTQSLPELQEAKPVSLFSVCYVLLTWGLKSILASCRTEVTLSSVKLRLNHFFMRFDSFSLAHMLAEACHNNRAPTNRLLSLFKCHGIPGWHS